MSRTETAVEIALATIDTLEPFDDEPSKMEARKAAWINRSVNLANQLHAVIEAGAPRVSVAKQDKPVAKSPAKQK